MRTVCPVEEVRIVTDAPVGALRAIVILPSRLDVVVLHRLLSQTSTCLGPRIRAMNRDCGLCLDDGQFGSNWFIHRNKYRRPNPDRGLFSPSPSKTGKGGPLLASERSDQVLGIREAA